MRKYITVGSPLVRARFQSEFSYNGHFLPPPSPLCPFLCNIQWWTGLAEKFQRYYLYFPSSFFFLSQDCRRAPPGAWVTWYIEKLVLTETTLICSWQTTFQGFQSASSFRFRQQQQARHFQKNKKKLPWTLHNHSSISSSVFKQIGEKERRLYY